MKKAFLFLSLLFVSLIISAQQQGLSYQAVARDGGGQLLANENVAVKFTILQNNPAPAGLLVYQETHNTTTNDYGLFSLTIGEGNILNGSWPNIDWPAGPHFLQVEIDEGSGYINMGTTELVSVPYAKHANTASALTDPDWIKSGNELTNTNNGLVTINNAEFPNNAATALQLDSMITFSNGQLGQLNFAYTNTDGQWVVKANNLSSNNTPKLVIDDDGDGLIVEEQITINSSSNSPKPKTLYANSMPIAYGFIQAGGGVTGGYGISSATMGNLGEYTINLSNAAAGTTIPIATCYDRGMLEHAVISGAGPNSVNVNTFDANGTPTSTNFFIVIFGTPQ